MSPPYVEGDSCSMAMGEYQRNWVEQMKIINKFPINY